MTEMKYFKSNDGDILGNTVYLELDNGIEMELAITVHNQLQMLCYRHVGGDHWIVIEAEQTFSEVKRLDFVEIIPKLLITPGYAMDEADEEVN